MRSTRREHMYRRGIGTRRQALTEAMESRQLLSGNGATCLAIGNTLFFSADGGNHVNVLWKSNLDGSDKQIVKNTAVSPRWLTNLNGTLIFAAGDLSGTEPWRSDGTDAGTQQLKDIYTGMSSSNPRDFMILNGHLIFTAEPTRGWAQLYVTDGTGAGTRSLLSALYPQRTVIANRIVVKDNAVYFESTVY